MPSQCQRGQCERARGRVAGGVLVEVVETTFYEGLAGTILQRQQRDRRRRNVCGEVLPEHIGIAVVPTAGDTEAVTQDGLAIADALVRARHRHALRAARLQRKQGPCGRFNPGEGVVNPGPALKTVVLTLNGRRFQRDATSLRRVPSRAGAVRRLTLRQAPIASREQERGTASSGARSRCSTRAPPRDGHAASSRSESSRGSRSASRAQHVGSRREARDASYPQPPSLFLASSSWRCSACSTECQYPFLSQRGRDVRGGHPPLPRALVRSVQKGRASVGLTGA